MASSIFVYTASKALAETLFPSFGADRWRVLHRHIEVPDPPANPTPTGLFQREGAIRLGVFAWLNENKGQEDAVRAIAQLVAEGHDIELLLAGGADPNYRSRLEALIAQQGLQDHVRLPGFVADQFAAMRETDIILVSSHLEGFSRVGLEGMLLGKPVFYTAVGGLLEYMIDGRTGVSYPPGDLEALAKAIRRLLADQGKMASLGAEAHRYARSRFNREAYGGEVYRTLSALRAEPLSCARMPSLMQELLGHAIAESTQEMAEQKRELEKKEAALQDHCAEAENVRQDLGNLRNELAAREADLANLHNEFAARDTDAEGLRAGLQTARIEIAAREYRIQELQRSISWRVTAPLRWVGRLFLPVLRLSDSAFATAFVRRALGAAASVNARLGIQPLHQRRSEARVKRIIRRSRLFLPVLRLSDSAFAAAFVCRALGAAASVKARLGIRPLHQRLSKARVKRIIRRSRLFDATYYLAVNLDVALAHMDPVEHFIEFGAAGGRNPGPFFDTRYYLESNPDVVATAMNPLLHYIEHGVAEGRKPTSTYTSTSNRTAGVGCKGVARGKLDLLRRSLAYLRQYGIRAFYWEVRSRLAREPVHATRAFVPVLILPKIAEDDVLAPYGATISVVIPTKNAGDGFALLMAMLNKQRGFRDIEIIVVDSGSTDSTVSVAKEYGAQVIEMAPERFSHSFARNLGADNASGTHLFFTVQDALPPSQTFLYELFGVLTGKGVAAVSCAEFPREDADLFYTVLLWHHYRFLEVDGKDRILSLPERQTHSLLRKNGQLSDLACLIPKDIFMRYRYRNDYAEDLDLGMRLIKDGFRLAFLSSVRIIHSHNRPPWYYLRRGYVDNLFLSRLFPDFVVPPVREEDLFKDMLAFGLVHRLLAEELPRLKTPMAVDELFSFIKGRLTSAGGIPSAFASATVTSAYVDEGFAAFLGKVAGVGTLSDDYGPCNEVLIPALLSHLEIAREYMRSAYPVVDETVIEKVAGMVVKVFALQLGAHLAYSYRNGGRVVRDFHDELIKNI